MKRIICVFVVLCSVIQIQAQNIRKGKLYAYWGYNRSVYGKSDIKFTGPGYDFELKDVAASDRPSEWDASVYLNPGQFTVPQFDFRIGYFLNDRYSISAGWDHLKYVMDNNQMVRMSGYINEEAHDDLSKDGSGESHIGTYDNDWKMLDKGFMKYEHTDGLNYIRVTIERTDELYSIPSKKFNVLLVNGIGTGLVMPWTDFTFMGGKRHMNRPHLSGFAFSYHSGLKLEFLKSFFIQSNVATGYIMLPWVETKMKKADRAKQNFAYAEWNVTAGFYLNLNKLNFRKKAE